MKILAIETSCDDTAIAILQASKTGDFKVLSNIVSSQIEVHKKYGGVYPAMAKREHQRNLVPVLTRALEQAKLLTQKSKVKSQNYNLKLKTIKNILEREPELEKKLIIFLKKHKKSDIDLIAVTNGPGLEPCLWVGVNFAKALSYAWNMPVVSVNHIEAHILVNYLNNKKINFPAIALVVSGGHTQLILVKGIGKYKILGETRDDAAGECFDKCAKILGLKYPGGPVIAALAAKSQIQNSKSKINSKFQIPKLPRPMINTKDYDFSFSGLKTAVLYSIKNSKFEIRNSKFLASIAREIQQAIIDVLIKKTMKAVKHYKAKTLILGGGVSANQELRRQFQKAVKTNGSTAVEPFNLLFPPANLSTDNAVMTAITAYFHRNKKASWKTLKANSNLRISK